MRHSDFPALRPAVAPSAIYFDWPLDLRGGGPPGYLANLEQGLQRIDRAADVAVITRDPQPTVDLPSAREAAKIPLFAMGAAHTVNPALGNLDAQTEFLARPDRMAVRTDDLVRLSPQDRSIIHVHTTIDAIKMHNTLTRLGQRHTTKLLLTSHCPEAPASEWAAKAFHDGASQEAVERYYHAHLDLDLTAFGVADVLVFPTPEAMEPYRATLRGFDQLFGQRDVRFLPSGVAPLAPPQDPASLRRELGIDAGFVVSYLGRHNRVKGYDTLSTVGTMLLERDPDMHILVGGREGPLPTPDHPRWQELGWTDRPGDVLAASDVFVLPNQQTYFDLMLLEVLSAGRPVIAARTGGNRHFEGLSQGVRLYDGADELAAAVNALKCESPRSRAAMGAANRALYDAQYTQDAFAQRYVELLDGVRRSYRLPAPRPSAEPAASRGKRPPTGPKASVIVPVYNVESFLDICLSSIAAQTESDIEVLVINDGSTDGSPAIIDAQCARDPRFVRIDRPNGGLSAARNTGLDAARGEFISFVDSDDAIHPDMLRDLVAAAERSACDVAVCGVSHIDETGAVTSVATSFLDDEGVYPHLSQGQLKVTPETLTGIYPSAWNKIYRARIFEDLRYDSGLLFEDHPVFYKALGGCDSVAYVAAPLYLHRDHGAGRITRIATRRILDVFVVLDLIESRLRGLVPDRKTCRRTMARLILRLVWERSFAVSTSDLRFKLAEGALMRFARWGLEREHVEEARDSIIPVAFVADLYRWAEMFGGWDQAVKAKHLLSSQIRVANRTSGPPETQALVAFDTDANFVLVHPHPTAVTTAEVAGFGFFGPGEITFNICLEHVQANEIEFRAMLAPVSIEDTDRLDRADDPIWLAQTGWTPARSGVAVPVAMHVDDGSPTLALYIQSRVPEGRNAHFCWLRLRALRVDLGCAS